jgi:hypothetical protein
MRPNPDFVHSAAMVPQRRVETSMFHRTLGAPIDAAAQAFKIRPPGRQEKVIC